MWIHQNSIIMEDLYCPNKNHYLLIEIQNKNNVDESTNNFVFKQVSSKGSSGIMEMGSINMPLQF